MTESLSPISLGMLPSVDDFTFICNDEIVRSYYDSIDSTACSYSGKVHLKGFVFNKDDNKLYKKECYGRGLICRCGDNLSSVTVRIDNDNKIKNDNECKYYFYKIPYKTNFDSLADSSFNFPVSFQCIYSTLFNAIFKKSVTPDHGLVVLFGTTSCGKSNIVRGLIDQYLCKRLENRGKKERRLHLLTLEDPIETLYRPKYYSKFLDVIPSCWERKDWPVDYTPRCIRSKDFEVNKPTLIDSLKDALRQTPSIVYIGEVREPKDWKAVIEFAGTGHLVITTAHAGSLTEGMERIFQVMGAESPLQRGQIAQRILAIAHLQQFVSDNKVKGEITKSHIVLPSLWRYTPYGQASLVSDGLSSLIPYYPSADDPQISSLGKRWFAERIIKKAKNLELELKNGKNDDAYLPIPLWKNKYLTEKFINDIYELALNQDIEGM